MPNGKEKCQTGFYQYFTHENNFNDKKFLK